MNYLNLTIGWMVFIFSLVFLAVNCGTERRMCLASASKMAAAECLRSLDFVDASREQRREGKE